MAVRNTVTRIRTLIAYKQHWRRDPDNDIQATIVAITAFPDIDFGFQAECPGKVVSAIEIPESYGRLNGDKYLQVLAQMFMVYYIVPLQDFFTKTNCSYC